MSEEAIKELARERTRDALGRSVTFRNLSVDEQKSLYLDLYKQEYSNIQKAQAQAQGATGYVTQSSNILPSQSFASKKASDFIEDQRHENRRIEQAGDLAGDFIDQVDFPGFVQDLLKGVFDANLKVTLEQMESFQKLLKTATKDLSSFIQQIDNTAAFGYLAENNSDDFNIDFSDSGNSDQPQAILTDSSGEPVDMSDNEVKAKIMEAKIKMAQVQRGLLREALLAGVSRLVVEKGNVKASVLFDIKAGERIEKGDKAALKNSISSGSSIAAGGGLIGKIFGAPSGGHARSRRKTKISVSSAKSAAATDMAAKIAGSVDITFKSDYFKLDNFATMYGPTNEVNQQAGAPAIAPPVHS